MTIDKEFQLDGLKHIGGIVARTLEAMRNAAEPGMTTAELDAIGAAMLELEGAKSAPKVTYNFPGATCISVFPAIAHGIPNKTVLKNGHLINIDVSAEKNGYFADTGASFVLQGKDRRLEALCRDGKKALWTGINEVKVGGALHEEPGEIPTWKDLSERRRINEGLVFTLEPFLSMGAGWAVDSQDGWTLYADRRQSPTVQYEHTMVATKNGTIITTLAA